MSFLDGCGSERSHFVSLTPERSHVSSWDPRPECDGGAGLLEPTTGFYSYIISIWELRLSKKGWSPGLGATVLFFPFQPPGLGAVVT